MSNPTELPDTAQGLKIYMDYCNIETLRCKRKIDALARQFRAAEEKYLRLTNKDVIQKEPSHVQK